MSRQWWRVGLGIAALAFQAVFVGAVPGPSEAAGASVRARLGPISLVSNSPPWRRFSDPSAIATDLGYSVAYSGNVALIGASDSTQGDIGEVLLYQRTKKGWSSPVTLLPPAAGGANFGIAVAVSGDAAVVGAPFAKGGAGGVYVYARSTSGWPTTPTTFIPNPEVNNDFGRVVAIKGNTVIVGAFGYLGPGSAYVYEHGRAGWPTSPTTTLSDPAATDGDYFGYSVAVSSTAIIVGALSSAGGNGSAYLYEHGPSGWPGKPTVTLPAPKAALSGCFGTAVAVRPTSTAQASARPAAPCSTRTVTLRTRSVSASPRLVQTSSSEPAMWRRTERRT